MISLDLTILFDILYFICISFCLFLLLEEKITKIEVIYEDHLEIKERYNDDVILEGDMYKQGHLVRSWKKRHFVLNPFRICYFEGKTLKGS